MIVESDGDRSSAADLMVFSPWCYGHYPSYLYHLIRYWQQHNAQGVLSIVVVPRFLRDHQDIVELAADSKDSTIRFLATTIEEQNSLETAASGYKRALIQYHLMSRYAERFQASHCLIMYLDSCQLAFVAGWSFPCPVSGIYFRPTFHYPQLTHIPPTWKERLQQWREHFFLARLLAHPQFSQLFCLDPFVVNIINQRYCSSPAVYLPDPVEFQVAAAIKIATLRASLNIEPDRKILLAFGRLADSRKGTAELIKALSSLPDELCRQLCLLLVGEPDPSGQSILESWLSSVRQSLPMQIVTNYGYIPESDVSQYFQLSDIVLAPYQKHVGMSGILLLAAAAQKPVLGSNYGLMGEMIRYHKLGVAVDTTSISELARGLSCCLLEPQERLFDQQQARYFAQQNSPNQFASTIFQHLSPTATRLKL